MDTLPLSRDRREENGSLPGNPLSAAAQSGQAAITKEHSLGGGNASVLNLPEQWDNITEQTLHQDLRTNSVALTTDVGFQDIIVNQLETTTSTAMENLNGDVDMSDYTENVLKLLDISNLSTSDDGFYMDYNVNSSLYAMNATTNATTPAAIPAPQYWAILLSVVPLLTVFGNLLICISVYREKQLRTVTNYFIVSLAVADIMVATLVMPLAVYVEVLK